MSDQSVLQGLYDSKINFDISTDWEAGFRVRLGDKTNGFTAEATARTYADAVQHLQMMATRRFPRSAFAKKHATAEVDSPPLAPEGFDTDVYLVLEEFDHLGRAYRGTDEARADRDTMIRDLISGQYDKPVRIVAFNTAKEWSQDVSAEIAREISDWASRKGEELTGPVQTFVEREAERAERRRRSAPLSTR